MWNLILNVGNHWSAEPHHSHVITHGTTEDFEDVTPSTGISTPLFTNTPRSRYIYLYGLMNGLFLFQMNTNPIPGEGNCHHSLHQTRFLFLQLITQNGRTILIHYYIRGKVIWSTILREKTSPTFTLDLLIEGRYLEKINYCIIHMVVTQNGQNIYGITYLTFIPITTNCYITVIVADTMPYQLKCVTQPFLEDI